MAPSWRNASWTLPLVLCCTLSPAHAASTALDRRLILDSRAEATQLWREGWTITDPVLLPRLQSILDSMTVGRARDTSIVLRAELFRSPVPNAFCLPDGSVFVFVGLLAEASDWDQVAFVLAHEAEHALGWHAQRHAEQAKGKVNVLGVLSLATGSGSLAALLGQVGLALTASAMINGYGRALEAEADAAAITAMTRTGRPPCAGAEALAGLLRGAEEESATSNFFWGDHPMLRQRIAAIAATVPGGCPAGPGSIADDYAALRDSMTRLSARLFLEGDDLPGALRDVGRCVARDSTNAADRVLLGEIWLRTALRKRTARDTIGRADTLALAEGQFRRALELEPSAAVPWRGLGTIAEARGDRVAAIDCLQRYLGSGPDVPNRRQVRRRLEELKASTGALAPVDSTTGRSGTPPDHPR